MPTVAGAQPERDRNPKTKPRSPSRVAGTYVFEPSPTARRVSQKWVATTGTGAPTWDVSVLTSYPSPSDLCNFLGSESIQNKKLQQKLSHCVTGDICDPFFF